MKLTHIALHFALASTFALAACGGSGEAAGLKYRVADKELRGLTGDGIMKIDAARGEVTTLEDAYALGDVTSREKKQSLGTTESEKKAAGDAIDVANDKIEQTADAQEKELAQARGERDKRIADAKAQYDEKTKQIREKRASEQAANRKVLADAKTTQQLAAIQQSLLKAELAETTARQNLRKQEIRVAKANLEVVRYEQLLAMTGVVGPKETQRKINFDQQAVNEQKKLIDLQSKLLKAEAATNAERTKYDTEKAKLSGPKPE